MKKIAVLLAAYNCEKYLREQLDSILNQSNVSVTIYISLDKSKDSSLEIIESYTKKYRNVNLLEYGKIYGSAGQNFFRLICDIAIDDYDYVCFSDQDDIWFRSKLSHGVDVLIKSEADAYSANVIAYWDDGYTKLVKKNAKQVKYDYLFESAGPGCTYIFAKDKFKLFQNYLIENRFHLSKVWLHDWLAYSYYRGNKFKWIIDERPLMYYRQHSNNELGANFNIRSLLIRAKKLLKKNGDQLVLNQAEFLKQTASKPINLLTQHRSGFLQLAMMSKILRRKKTDKFFCMLYFFFRYLRGY